MDALLIDQGYQKIEPLGQGCFGVVYKARKTGADHDVALKVIRREVLGYRGDAVLKLRQEVGVLSGLDHRALAAVRAVGEWGEKITLETEYIDPIDVEAFRKRNNRLEPQRATSLLTQITEGLGHLHGNGLVHRNLKPSNIMIARRGDELDTKILDFGLSRLVDYSDLLKPEAFANAVHYISPEQTGILQWPVDHRSDLYSLGVIFYELLTGRRPFEEADLNTVLHQHVARAPLSAKEIEPDIPEAVDRIVMRLLKKDPDERYPDAQSLLTDLDNTLREPGGPRKPGLSSTPAGGAIEIARLKTSLIGRDRELRLLQNALARCSHGVATMVLVSGPAGIGKTRLVNTLREPLLRKEGIFLMGKCNEFAEPLPFGPIRDALEDLGHRMPELSPGQREVFLESLSDMEQGHQDALVRFIPVISDLLDQRTTEGMLEPERGKERFYEALIELIGRIARPGRPAVLFLDDLQWADEGTLEILSQAADRLGKSNFMIIGAFRDDAIGRRHPLRRLIDAVGQDKAQGIHFTVEPLNPIEVEMMVGEMLGGGEQADETLIKELLLRGEGNPFFISEMIKSMVEAEALQCLEGKWTCKREWLYQLGAGSNIIDIIVRRVDTFPPEQLHVLIMASIIGVRFHFNMLLGLVDREESVVVEALNRAVRMQLIRSVSSEKERIDQFFHDKIREALYLKAPAEKRKSLHLRIARQIETMERARGERIYELAYHYDEGGDAPGAYKYAVEAGNLAREQFAYKEALKYFERASGLMDEGLPDTHSTRERTVLTEDLGDIHSILGDYEKAIQYYKERLSYEATDLERASLERRIGKTYYRKAAYRESVDHLDRALAILGGRRYGTRLKIHGENFMRFIHHLLRRVLRWSPIRTWPDSPSRDDIRKLELARIYRDLTYVYFFLDTEWMIVLFFRFLSLAEALKEPSLCGDAYCMLSLLYSGGMARPKSGLRYMNASRAIRRKLSDRWGLAQCTSWCGVSHLYRSELEEGHSFCKEGRSLFDEIGDRWEFENISIHLSLIHILRGEFSKAIECSRVLEGRALEQENYSGIVGAGWGMGVSYLHLGEPEKARGYIDRVINISERAEQPFLRGIAFSIDGLYHTHRKEFDVAVEHLKRATRTIVETHFHGYYEFLLWIPLADAHLKRAEANREDPGGIQEDLKAARTIIRFGKRRAFPHPHYSGLLEIMRGRERWLRGRYRAAERSFSRGISRLEATDASFLTATAHAEIGRLCLPRDPTKGRRHLRKAEKLLAETEAGEELAHVRFLLDEGYEDPSGQLKADVAEGPTLRPLELKTPSTVLSKGVDFIARTGQCITAADDLEGLCEGILNLCIEAVGAERGCVTLLEISEEMDEEDESKSPDDSERKPLIRLARSLDRSEIEWSRFQYGRSVFTHVAHEGEPIIVDDASSDDRFDLAEEVRHRELRSILCVPLKHGDEILGAIYLDNRLLSRVFSLEHQRLISVVADQTVVAIRNILAREKLRSQDIEIEDLRREIRDGTAFQGEDITIEHDFEEIVGSSDEIKSVLRLIEKVAPLGSTVLIRGESGTGKELVARAVHNLSTGKDRSMVKVNCAALPEGLLESELFGHERGAFTDAHRRKIGRFEVAKGGSIFLDEIGELSQKLQAKLLRVIQDGEFERVGGIEPIKSDARLIAATNRNLEEAIEDGRFREDLFYRLNVLPIHVPPLRDRRGDIPLLITYFVNKLNRKFDRTFTGIERSSMDAMLRYDWPGNVRELQNVIERAMILSEGPLLHAHGIVSGESSSPAGDLRFQGTYSEMIKEFKRKMIKEAIAVSGGNKSAAARRLGIDPTYLSRLIKQLDIE